MFPKMRRFKQQLSDEECEKVLADAPRGVLSLLGNDGYPYGIMLNFVYDAAAHKIYFHGAKQGHKVEAMQRNPKASFLVRSEGWHEQPEDWFFCYNSVIAFGRMSIITDEAERLHALEILGDKLSPSRDYTMKEIEKFKDNVLVTALSLEHMTGKRVREK